MKNILNNDIEEQIKNDSKVWLITGVAGFIGSNLLEYLLGLNQKVIGIDNFSTGFVENLNDVKEIVGPEKWINFKLYECDICDSEICSKVFYENKKINYVLHEAALGSVPRSIANPILTNDVNIKGFLNILLISIENKVDKFIYAASSSTYGDHKDLPKIESKIGNPLSPYAVTKYVNELYGSVFSQIYNANIIGLRYFNVFGKRQNPFGDYAAVIPKWATAILQKKDIEIFGDGHTARDFCFIKNVIQANVLAAISKPSTQHEVFNIAYGEKTTLNQLVEYIGEETNIDYKKLLNYSNFRIGDVRQSLADIEKAKSKLNYNPKYNIQKGIVEYMEWLTPRINKK
jgi:UDP-N-acetylglucosamine/UDP-N-acetylgalactosamine 4-epimerase